MKDSNSQTAQKSKNQIYFWIVFLVICIAVLLFFVAPMTLGKVAYNKSEKVEKVEPKPAVLGEETVPKPKVVAIDPTEFDKKMLTLANNPPPVVPKPKVVKTTVKKKDKNGKIVTTVETKTIPAPVVTPKPNLWPTKAVYPNPGALLPFNRIIAYYGNLYSKKMGVLGEYPEAEMLSKLQGEVDKWKLADPETPVIPALHYIVTVAQGAPGADGKYRFRMSDSEIQKVIKMADKIHGIVFLDIQIGLSSVQSELPPLKKYLEMPNVHLGIDPEFAMGASGKKPGKVIGTLDGDEINFAIKFLADIVKDKNIPPKVLVIHRFTQGMLTNYKKIEPTPEVQVVMNMDGWGGKAKKIGTYKNFIYPQPVQFTGFKLFYKNDIKEKNTKILEPSELLKLNPRPIYIQYQ